MSASFFSRASPARGSTLSGKIVAAIRDDVFAGRMKPGDVLGSENELAQRFGVSRITVRDALRSLSATGVVEIRQGAGGGARIADANLDHFADALAVQFQLAEIDAGEALGAQSAVEGMAAELAAEHRTSADLDRMAAAIEQASALVDDPAAFTEASLAFHLAVAEASHNRALFALLRALRYAVWGETKRATTEVTRRVLTAHRAIYERIEAGDGNGARAAMSQHLGGIRDSKTRSRAELTC